MMQIEGLTLGAVLLILVKEIASSFSDSRKKNTQALEANTHAVIKLETKIEHIMKRLDDLPEMQKDINALHEKVRNLNGAKGAI